MKDLLNDAKSSFVDEEEEMEHPMKVAYLPFLKSFINRPNYRSLKTCLMTLKTMKDEFSWERLVTRRLSRTLVHPFASSGLYPAIF